MSGIDCQELVIIDCAGEKESVLPEMAVMPLWFNRLIHIANKVINISLDKSNEKRT